ncbi:MAG TPA: TetR/AcrR family transcriptional regulator [Solirubrobacteraceae bacterium]
MKTRARRRRLPPDERRALIEDAAARLFADRGYAATRLEDIAAAAGVTKPILYRHYDNKKALHLELLAKHRDGLLEQLAAHAVAEGPFAERLPVIIDAWYAYVEEHPYAWRLLFRDTTGDPEIQAFHRELQAGARRLIMALLEGEPEIAVTGAELEPLAEAVRSATTGLALWWLDHPGVERAQLVAVLTRVMRGL